MKEKNLLLAFYGDDLTGSTDALAFISSAGAKTVLFLQPPTIEQLNSFDGLQAYGVAGLTRSLPSDQMEHILKHDFQMIKESAPRRMHYKVCSAFDSSPEIGSIGKAIDVGAEIFPNKFIPVLGGMPSLGRYCAFGNLFAKMGTVGKGNIYRLDRHPSMSKHPVTPSDESDLRIHLGKQTKKKFGLIDITQIENDVDEWNNQLRQEDEVVLIDVLTNKQVEKIGEWLDVQQEGDQTLFSVGSSGIEMALGRHWNKSGLLKPRKTWPTLRTAEPLLVISGSCSPVTKKQIAYAVANGFVEIPFEVEFYREGRRDDFTLVLDFLKAEACLENKQNVIVHTGHLDNIEPSLLSQQLGSALGSIASDIIRSHKLKRLVVAGGDTSSYVGGVLGIEALEMIAPMVSGAPLCRARSSNQHINGMEINFKGGQVGAEDYFVRAALGK